MSETIEAKAEEGGKVRALARKLPAALTPMDMLAQAISQGAGIDVLEKLMALHERWEANQGRREFDEAVSLVKAKIPPITKNREGHNSKRYADFAAIAKVVDPIIAEHGLSYRFRTRQDDKIHVTCVLSHRAGHSEETTLAGPADNSGNKNAIQSIGSTLTYLQRYSLVQMLGLAAAEDDDGKAVGNGEPITAERVKELRKLIQASAREQTSAAIQAAENSFLAWAHVEKVEDVLSNLYDGCVAGLKNKIAQRKGAAS